MPPLDYEALKQQLVNKYGKNIRDFDVTSAAIYPKVFAEYRDIVEQFGDLSEIPTRYFLSKPEIGEEFNVSIEEGKTLIIKLLAVGSVNAVGKREVFFELNGEARVVMVTDKTAAVDHVQRERANPANPGDVAAPMSGVVIEVRAKVGAHLKVGDPVCVLSAMKMETVVGAPVAGLVEHVAVIDNDSLNQGDLVCRIVKDEKA